MYQRSIIGILSLLIIWLASFGSQIQNGIDVDEKAPVADIHTSNDDKQTEPESSLKIVAYEAVLPLIQANVTTISYFFIKLQVILDHVMEGESDFVVPHISYFNTLFRLIIAPNAP